MLHRQALCALLRGWIVTYSCHSGYGSWRVEKMRYNFSRFTLEKFQYVYVSFILLIILLIINYYNNKMKIEVTYIFMFKKWNTNYFAVDN